MKKVIFMGTPNFSVPILKAVNELDGYKIVAVFTQPDRKVGRKQEITYSPVKQTALDLHLSVYQPEKLSGSEELQQAIDLQPDLIITAAYGQFLPTKFLNSASIAAINVHASLLPKYRGGAPIQHAIMNGDSKTGVTIMHMIKQMDAGDIIAQQSISIEEADNAGTMFEKLSVLGKKLLLETLPKIIDNPTIGMPQDETNATFSPNITDEDRLVDFSQLTARQISNRTRGLLPFFKPYFVYLGQRINLLDVVPTSDVLDENYQTGEIISINKDSIEVVAKENTVISIRRWQISGKKETAIREYINGNSLQLHQGSRLSDSV